FAALAWWVWKNPEEGFLLFLITAPLLSMFKATQTIPTVTLIKDVIILTLFTKLFLVPACMKRLPYRRSILFAPAAMLVLWTALETLRADSLALGILRSREIILYLLFYFAVLYLSHSKDVWRRRLSWFTTSVFLTMVLAGYQWFFAADSAVLRFDPGRSIWIPRISSTFGHPSVYGEYLVAASTLFLSAALFLVRRNERVLFMALFLVTLPFIFLTYSRAVWIGFAAAMGVMGIVWFWKRLTSLALKQGGLSFVRRSTSPLEGEVGRQRPDEVNKNRWLLGIFGVLIIAALTVIVIRFTPAGPLLRSAFDPTYKSNEERLTFAARLVAPMSNLDALIGRGLGDVTAQQFRRVDVGAEEITAGASRDVQLAKDATLVDNQYLKTFVEMGLLGLVIYFWLFWRFAKGAWKSMQYAVNSTQKVVGLWSAGFLAAFIVQALFIDIWDIFPTNAMFWIVGAAVSAALTPVVESK
ncbi:MAG: O-antigen ligase family protein, partial [Patescibacteria group bacterium]